jgi:hypothetical protein
MKLSQLLIGLFIAVDIATAQTSAFHTFTPPPEGSDIEWPASILDENTLEYDPPAYIGFVRIFNQTNNPIFFDDNYVASGNSPLIDGNAMWGDARAGFPFDDPELFLDFNYFFAFDGETGDPIDEVLEVSFDFAWASSDSNATIDTLEIEVEDWWGNTETISVDLIDTFQHGLGGLGEGRTGRVTVIPENVDNIYLISFLNLRDGGGGGQINEWAIDNLSVGGAGPSGGELALVDYEGQPVSDYGTNVLKNTGIFGFSENVFNGTPEATNFSVLWSSNKPAMYQPAPMINVPIAPWATEFEAVRWEIDTNTALSGEYNGVFTVTNNNDPNDPDDTLTVNFMRVYDAPSLTDNTGTTLTAPGGQATLSNAAASGHPGALRASVKVTQVVQSNPRFSVSGINVGSEVNPGNTLTGTISYNPAGAPSGSQTGQMRVKMEMFGSPQTFLNRKTPVADRVWPLTFNVPAVPEVTPSVTSGQQLAEAGLAISGENSGAAVIGGVSPSDQSVALAFETSPPAPNPSGVGQAVGLDFGVSPTLYVLQLAYADLAPGYSEQDLRIHAFTAPSGPWVAAISLNGNSGATVTGATPYLGTYAEYLAELGDNSLDAADLGAFGIDEAGNTAWVVLDYDGTFQLVTGPNTGPPRILAITYDKVSNTTTITYQSLTGQTFGVRGGEVLTGLEPIGTTAIGTGAVMQYQHNPPAAPARYFYQMFRQ